MSDVNAKIETVVKSNDVVLFMKGTPLFPQCGFSSRAIAILILGRVCRNWNERGPRRPVRRPPHFYLLKGGSV